MLPVPQFTRPWRGWESPEFMLAGLSGQGPAPTCHRSSIEHKHEMNRPAPQLGFAPSAKEL